MWISKLALVLIVFYAASCYAQPEPAVPADCRLLRTRCDSCVRSLRDGLDKDNILGSLNRLCRAKVGTQYVWRDVKRCEMNELRCSGADLNCAVIAQRLGMPRRLS